MLAASLRAGIVALFWGALSLRTASAQAPISVYAMAYATVDENTFYVHGGVNIPVAGGTGIVMSQFYSLDLTQSGWETSSPPWKALVFPSNLVALSPPYSHSMSVSQDGKTLTTWNAGATLVANYSITSDSWTQVPYAVNGLTGVLHATTDPTTGAIYLPAGSPTNPSDMLKYTYATGQAVIETIPSTLVVIKSYYSFVWCQSRKSFILFTGDTTNTNPFFEFSPSKNQWSLLPTTGPNPPFRLKSCMEPAYNGTKIILFGGHVGTELSVANIYILDIKSMTWSEGPIAPDTRSHMACAVSGDNFIVWGGYKQTPPTIYSGVPTTPLIYDISTGQWTTKYIRRATVKPPTSSSSLNPLTPSTTPTNGLTSPGESGAKEGGESKVNGAAIGGGVAGGILVIAAIALIVVQRRRTRPYQHPSSSSNNNSKKLSEANSRHDHVFPSMENTSAGTACDNYSQVKSSQHQDKPTNPQYASRKQPQGTPNYQQTEPSSSHGESLHPLLSFPPPLSPPMIPPRPHAANPQYHNNQQQQQPYVMQDQSAWQYSSPQYCHPSAFFDTMPSVSGKRGPQGTAKPATAASDQDLYEQLNWIQAELSRRQTNPQP